ncbi:LacI family DNA-binding transcriptional regulator [Streptococcus suis]|nr:LacI family DNA-binding transcriptional regulator [Streptococcus suis]
MTTLADVAKRANVSKMTVSRVLNHPELVTEELKQMVLLAMKELDYQPNVVAKALAQQRTLTVQVIILEEMETVEPYYAELIAGISLGLSEKNYTMQIVTDRNQVTEQCDGYIVTGARIEDYGWLRSLLKPVVLFGENMVGLPFVDTHNKEATYQASRYAFEKGYEQVVFVGIDLPDAFAQSREAGYVEAMEELGHPPKIYRLENRSRVAEDFVRQLDLLSPNTCFICASDRIALGIERGLLFSSKRVPEDYGIIGFDGIFIDRVSRPQLTTMRQPFRKMGRITVKQLMTLVEGCELKEQKRFCQASLVVRESTRA